MTYERKRTAQRICQYCKKEFMALQNEVNRGKAKYCSLSCGVAFRNKSKVISPQQIFFKKISHESHPNGCWIYTKGNRYAKLDVNGKTVQAHRYSYELFNGVIPDGLYVCHKCDIKLCVNPDHLFLGTSQENRQDMMKKGRGDFLKGEKSQHAKLTEEKVKDIKELLGKEFSIKELAHIYKVSPSLIQKIKQGVIWKHLK